MAGKRKKIDLTLLESIAEDLHLLILFDLFERRCGGSLASSGVAHPGWFGSYRPGPDMLPVKDYHTVIYVYTRPIDAADRLFQLLKSVLKKAGYQEQEEILMERSAMWLVESAPLPGRR